MAGGQINEALISGAREKKKTPRIKSVYPFLFRREAEEMLAWVRKKKKKTVVLQVTSATKKNARPGSQ